MRSNESLCACCWCAGCVRCGADDSCARTLAHSSPALTFLSFLGLLLPLTTVPGNKCPDLNATTQGDPGIRTRRQLLLPD